MMLGSFCSLTKNENIFNVKIRYKFLVVIDEFLTVSLYQPNEFISRKQILSLFVCNIICWRYFVISSDSYNIDRLFTTCEVELTYLDMAINLKKS